MSVDLITLTFAQPIRGKEARAGYFPSDSLWGALYACDVMLQGSPLPPEAFQVSSAYPYLNGPMLPKPRISPTKDTGEGSDKKKFKELGFVHWEVFQKLSQGQGLTADELKNALDLQKQALIPRIHGEQRVDPVLAERRLKTALKTSKHRYEKPLAFVQKVLGISSLEQLTERDLLTLLNQLQTGRFSSQEERQRNTQDRIGAKTDTFYSFSVWQPQLYFLLVTQDQNTRERLLSSLRVLGDQGLGGMRSQGSGQFHAEVLPCPEDLQTSVVKGEGKRILLSLTHPTTEEIRTIQDAADTQYTLIKRDGYIDLQTVTRKSLWMLGEGSLVPGPIRGSVKDVRPEQSPIQHPVFRNGQAVSVGI